jgi:hypothetical protein
MLLTYRKLIRCILVVNKQKWLAYATNIEAALVWTPVESDKVTLGILVTLFCIITIKSIMMDCYKIKAKQNTQIHQIIGIMSVFVKK